MLYIVTVGFSDNSPQFEDFALGVLHSNDLNDLSEDANKLLSYFC